jgi:hypothetical protein
MSYGVTLGLTTGDLLFLMGESHFQWIKNHVYTSLYACGYLEQSVADLFYSSRHKFRFAHVDDVDIVIKCFLISAAR